MFRKRFLFLSLLSLILTFSVACNKDEDPTPTSGGTTGGSGGGGGTTATFSAVINGDAFTSHPLFIAGTSGSSSGLYFRGATGSSITSSDTTTIVLSITFPDQASFVTGSSYSGVNGPFGDFAFGFYAHNQNSPGGVSAASTDLVINNALVNVTNVDLTAETWSGTFSFDAEDDDGIIHSITNGVFSNVEYD